MKKRFYFLIFSVFLFSSCNKQSNSGINDERFPLIQDESRYIEVMTSFEDHPAIQHFPDSIPLNATEVQFVYQPRIMQGAMFVELLMTLPEDEIENIESKYGDIAKYQFTTTNIPEDLPEPILYLLSNENDELDKDFYLIILDAQPAGKEDFPWNHGTYYGIGINKRDSQVIYWCEYW